MCAPIAIAVHSVQQIKSCPASLSLREHQRRSPAARLDTKARGLVRIRCLTPEISARTIHCPHLLVYSGSVIQSFVTRISQDAGAKNGRCELFAALLRALMLSGINDPSSFGSNCIRF